MDVAVDRDLAGAKSTRSTRGATADAVISRHTANPHVRVAIPSIGGVAAAIDPKVTEGVVAKETERGSHRTLTTEDEDIRGIGRADDARENTRIIVGIDLGVAVDADVTGDRRAIDTERTEATRVTEAQGSRGSTARRRRVRVTNAREDKVISEGRVGQESLTAILDHDGRTAELRRRT